MRSTSSQTMFSSNRPTRFAGGAHLTLARVVSFLIPHSCVQCYRGYPSGRCSSPQTIFIPHSAVVRMAAYPVSLSSSSHPCPRHSFNLFVFTDSQSGTQHEVCDSGMHLDALQGVSRASLASNPISCSGAPFAAVSPCSSTRKSVRQAHVAFHIVSTALPSSRRWLFISTLGGALLCPHSMNTPPVTSCWVLSMLRLEYAAPSE